MKDKEMNFNYSECIKTKSNIGETTYYNICNNDSYKITWGSADWIGSVFTFTLLILIVTFIIYFIKEMFWD